MRRRNDIQRSRGEERGEFRDFGILKTKGIRQRQVQAEISSSNDMQFSRLSGERILRILRGNDLTQIRGLSKYFAQTNGIYSRAVRYLSDIYRFDFLLYPDIDLDDDLNEAKQKKILKRFNDTLEYFDLSNIQSNARKWAAQICLEGVYYGYICDDVRDRLVVQDLPSDFCRSRFLYRGKPVVEFNVQYFDKVANEESKRNQILDLFPIEIKKGYLKYSKNRSERDSEWIILDLKRAFKFSFYGNDTPPFVSAIPSLINLDEVHDLEKEKLLQELQSILVQQFDLDKNGEIPFSMTELQALNQNAIDMVGDAVGVSVLSTVANVHLEDLSPEAGTQSQGKAGAAQDSVYSDMGISSNLFNTVGNLAMEKSVITDAAYAKQLLLQFESFLNSLIEEFFNKGNLTFKIKILETTIFNHKDLSNHYKDLTKIGFSRFLPMVSMGHSQKEVASMAKLEQQIMGIDNWMLPPFSSNTMSSDTWSDIKALQQSSKEVKINKEEKVGEKASEIIKDVEEEKIGRPEKPDDQKSDKTIANKESMS